MKRNGIITFTVFILALFSVNIAHSQQSVTTENELAGYLKKGQELYSKKEYDQAIMQFQKYISTSNGTQQADLALLLQAKSFYKLNDKNTAQLIFRKLQSSYPDSKYAGMKFEDIDTIEP